MSFSSDKCKVMPFKHPNNNQAYSTRGKLLVVICKRLELGVGVIIDLSKESVVNFLLWNLTVGRNFEGKTSRVMLPLFTWLVSPYLRFAMQILTYGHTSLKTGFKPAMKVIPLSFDQPLRTMRLLTSLLRKRDNRLVIWERRRGASTSSLMSVTRSFLSSKADLNID